LIVVNERVPHEDLEVGTKYRVELEDCCISGSFTATFLGWQDEDRKPCEYSNEDPCTSMWGNGVILGPAWGAWNCQEAA
jgi:hypothetical protein